MSDLDNLPTEDELAALAYAALRAEDPAGGPETLDELPGSEQQRWINRVGGYLELRWGPEDDKDAMDRHVREVCEAHAFPAE